MDLNLLSGTGKQPLALSSDPFSKVKGVKHFIVIVFLTNLCKLPVGIQSPPQRVRINQNELPWPVRRSRIKLLVYRSGLELTDV